MKTMRPDCVCRPQSAELTDDTATVAAIAVAVTEGLADAIVSRGTWTGCEMSMSRVDLRGRGGEAR